MGLNKRKNETTARQAVMDARRRDVAALRLLAGRRQKGESSRAVQGCNDFLRMGPGRSIAALARHAGGKAPFWFRRGLKDPSSCVRLATAAQLSRLDPTQHREVFELALYDPNPDVARRAEKLIAGKGYARRTW